MIFNIIDENCRIGANIIMTLQPTTNSENNKCRSSYLGGLYDRGSSTVSRKSMAIASGTKVRTDSKGDKLSVAVPQLIHKHTSGRCGYKANLLHRVTPSHIDEEKKLLFLSRLYQCWPWYLDQDAIIEIQSRIINLQHRQIAKMKCSNDLNKSLAPKNKKNNRKEYSPRFCYSPNNAAAKLVLGKKTIKDEK